MKYSACTSRWPITLQFVLNDQETNRGILNVTIETRTLFEHYLRPFQQAVDAGVGAVMCSCKPYGFRFNNSTELLILIYHCDRFLTDNRIGGMHSCEDSGTLSILKNDMGFNGFVVTDWWASSSTVASANGLSDMAMPGNIAYGDESPLWGSNLLVKIGTEVPQARLDDMARRVLSAWVMSGQVAQSSIYKLVLRL